MYLLCWTPHVWPDNDFGFTVHPLFVVSRQRACLPILKPSFLGLSCNVASRILLNRICGLTYKVEAAQDFFHPVVCWSLSADRESFIQSCRNPLHFSQIKPLTTLPEPIDRHAVLKPSSLLRALSGIFYVCLCRGNTEVCLCLVTGWLIILSSHWAGIKLFFLW